MVRKAFVFLLITGIASGADIGDSGQAPVILTPSSSRVLAVAPFAYAGSVQCDKKGNLYFYVGSAPNDSVIYKLLADGTHSVFGLTGRDTADNYYVGFHVDYDGKVWLLSGDKSDNPNVFEFHDDATSPNVIRLDAPEDLKAPTVRNFVSLQNGHILTHGYLNEHAAKADKGRSYVAEFDSAGKLIRKSVGKSSTGDVADWPAETPAIQGEDGLIYILEMDKVLVVAQTGKTIKEIALKPPEPNYRPYKMYVAGRRLVVGFYKEGGPKPKPSKLMTRYGLFDTSTGNQLRIYQSDDELGNNLVCFSDDGFTFFRVEHGRIKLVTAATD